MSMLFLLIAFAVLLYLLLVRKWNTFPASLVASFVLIILDGIPIWNGVQQIYAAAFGSSTGSYLILMTFGSLFGTMMASSGCALRIARVLTKLLGKKNAVVTVYFLTSLMIFGGISVLVVIFTVGPVGLAMWQESNLPRRLLCATTIAGGGGFALTSIPGTPNILNLLPTQVLPTDAMAAPMIGFISCIVQITLCLIFLKFMQKRYIKKGMGFEEVATAMVLEEADFGEAGLPSAFIAFLPVIIVISSVLFLSGVIDGGSTAAAALGMTVANIITYVINRKRFSKPLAVTITEGLQGGLNATVYMCALVGFGIVIRNSSAFTIISDFVSSLSAGGSITSVLFSAFVGVSIFVATTANGASGLDLFWKTLGDQFVNSGVNPQLLHRITVIASGGFDSVPHNSAYPVFNAVCGTEIKHMYPLVAVVTLVIPVIACLVCILFAGMGLV